jgi:two-component sensor histidine kinase
VTERVSGKPVLIVALGLTDQKGEHAGHIVAGIDLIKLQTTIQKQEVKAQAYLTLVDAEGTALPAPAFGAPVNVNRAHMARARDVPIGAIGSERDEGGEQWSYAVAPLAQDRLYLVYAMRDAVLYSSTLRHVATDIALPLIALLFASAAAWFAIELWAIRPAEALRALARHYAVADFDAAPPKLRHGPVEMIELRDEMTGMAKRAALRDDRLKRIAHQKDDLVKELHHRVKNNLQMVISLLSLQTRQLLTAAEKAPLEQAQGRISAMALVQRLTVETDHSPTIDACVLIDELCAQLRRNHRHDSARIALLTQCSRALIPTDLGVPFALFVFEAVTNAFRHGFPAAVTGTVSVRFAVAAAGEAVLEVIDSGAGWDDLAHPAGTGHRLLRAFSRQLGGHLVFNSHTHQGSHVCLTFMVPLALHIPELGLQDA